MSKDLSSLPVGTVLKGKYRIKSHLSSGGFGKTYLAVYGPYDTKVAIKEFFMNTANQREADGVSVNIDRTKENADAFGSQLAKFKKEYKRLKQINNAHVVKVHECFEQNGTAYYVMDFVEGDDLKGRLEQRGTPYAERTVIGYLKQILDGLAAIHSAGLLHLDIKPSNIMVDASGYVKLIDLGASKDYMQGGGASVYSSMARTNRYAPPEQMDGSYDKLGPWSDFYALGATIFYLLTRKEIPTWTEIFEDKSSDKHVALPMPGISEETKSLVVWFMNTDREKRPRSVAEILEKATGLLSDDEATKLIGKSGAESQSTDFSRKPRSYGKNDRQSKSGAEPQSKGSSSGCLDCLLDGLGRILGLLVLSFFLIFIVYKIIGPYIIEPYVEKQMQKEQLKREQLFKSQMQENFRLIFKFPKDSAENLK